MSIAKLMAEYGLRLALRRGEIHNIPSCSTRPAIIRVRQDASGSSFRWPHIACSTPGHPVRALPCVLPTCPYSHLPALIFMPFQNLTIPSLVSLSSKLVPRADRPTVRVQSNPLRTIWNRHIFRRPAVLPRCTALLFDSRSRIYCWVSCSL